MRAWRWLVAWLFRQTFARPHRAPRTLTAPEVLAAYELIHLRWSHVDRYRCRRCSAVYYEPLEAWTPRLMIDLPPVLEEHLRDCPERRTA